MIRGHSLEENIIVPYELYELYEFRNFMELYNEHGTLRMLRFVGKSVDTV